MAYFDPTTYRSESVTTALGFNRWLSKRLPKSECAESQGWFPNLVLPGHAFESQPKFNLSLSHDLGKIPNILCRHASKS